MNDPPQSQPSYQSLSDQQLAEIDELCDRFEKELVNGAGPRIEAFLENASKTIQDRLLAELISMEIEYCTQRGVVTEETEYIERFRQQESIIADLFAREAITQVPGNDTNAIPVNVPPVLANFRLIEEIGRGGMGVVWLAEQDKPVKRRVALKLIKSELASKDALARFDAENKLWQ